MSVYSRVKLSQRRGQNHAAPDYVRLDDLSEICYYCPTWSNQTSTCQFCSNAAFSAGCEGFGAGI